ncbi:MAG TPA: NfeD family protein [Candidatus Obscuribacterales bacterium]
MNLPNLLTLTVGPTPWLVGGLILLGFNLLIPEPTIAALGLAGLVTALVAVSITPLPHQLLIWGVLAAAFTLIMRGLLPKESKDLEPAKYARVCDPIPPGGMGRVQYEGAIWHARCQISDVAIADQVLVSVVDRQGTTLIVMPIPTSPSTPR